MLKHRVSVLVLALSLALPALVAAQGTAMGKAEQQVLQAEKDRFAAMIKVDEAALNRLLSDDLTYTHTSALYQTKAEFIGGLKSGSLKYVSIAPSEPEWQVRIYGTMAVVNGVANVHVIDPAKNDLTFKLRYTTVHINRGGSWHLVSWQATRFPQ